MLDAKGDTRQTDISAAKSPLPPLLCAQSVPGQTEEQKQETTTADTTTAPVAFPETLPEDPAALKRQCKEFYNSVSRQLNATEFAEFAHFLNYGYVADESPQYAAVALPKYFLNRNSVKLVLEMIGDCPIDGKRMLDVGCGRGGTVLVASTFFKPASVTGVDLSPLAISFCQNAHKGRCLSFQEGDAENLPFENSSFGIVTNVESSHSYPQIEKFYGEVHRVLRPGGHFLYTDVLPSEQIVKGRNVLQRLGLKLETECDVSDNVLLSCNEVATCRLAAFHDGNDPKTMNDFLGTPGSRFYEEIRSGSSRYMIWRFVKAAW
jgi:phthiocerol/phenolphthiocerol synthesis type-I polyketide synthase E